MIKQGFEEKIMEEAIKKTGRLVRTEKLSGRLLEMHDKLDERDKDVKEQIKILNKRIREFKYEMKKEFGTGVAIIDVKNGEKTIKLYECDCENCRAKRSEDK